MHPTISTSALGREGEADVARILEFEGWIIAARNFKAGHGEIDLVAVREDQILFVEVKRWSIHGQEELLRSIRGGKARRIIETSKIFLSKYRQYRGRHIRYDVVFLSPKREPVRYEGAFDESI
jgi:putative endonuclease